jgi:chromate transport protein ChrA
MVFSLLHDWALISGIAGLSSLGYLALRSDPKLLGWILLPTYMIHQFEEHYLDVKGERYAFQKFFCNFLGYKNITECPGDENFIFSVNVPGLYIAGILAGILNNIKPVVAGSFAAVILINALVHIAASIKQKRYNPGLLTSIILFIPVAIYYFYEMNKQDKLSWADIAMSVFIGILYHAVLMLSIKLIQLGKINHSQLNLINVMNGLTPLIVNEIYVSIKKLI